jgi:23S rRNA (adenine2503-C2)-methyltransferase
MNILELSHPELEREFQAMGLPRFRADQVWQWVWQKQARDFQEMTSLSKELRGRLAAQARLPWPRVVEVQESGDATRKLLLELADGARVETVLIPESGHFTQCLSTQVGCAMGCTFCATGGLGLQRDMTAGEILAQAAVARRHLRETGAGADIRNLVFMGMGEPLANLDNLEPALAALRHPLGLGFSSRRITVSTVGLPGRLSRFASLGAAQLAVSLHAPTQELRRRIMPAAAAFPVDELMAELAAYPLKPRERITIEYLLLGGVNDAPDQARELVRLLSGIKCKVNLIACNETGGAYRAPSAEAVEAFQDVLRTKNLTAMLRKSKGADIDAACGQLAARSPRA